ncbi:tRNA modification GTPase MnmE, partial [Tetrabaena socialis]
VLLLVMLAPRSYTAEDVVELHCHGGGVCAGRVLRAVIEAGARPARNGEFTLRAFLNGRLDLAQAESVAELLGARTPAAADSALAGLRGGVGEAVAGLRARCLDLLVELEA